MRTVKKDQESDVQTTKRLTEVELLTDMIREHQASIVRLSRRRRSLVLKLRERNVKYREIAEAMKSTEQNVYKTIRGDL